MDEPVIRGIRTGSKHAERVLSANFSHAIAAARVAADEHDAPSGAQADGGTAGGRHAGFRPSVAAVREAGEADDAGGRGSSEEDGAAASPRTAASLQPAVPSLDRQPSATVLPAPADHRDAAILSATPPVSPGKSPHAHFPDGITTNAATATKPSPTAPPPRPPSPRTASEALAAGVSIFHYVPRSGATGLSVPDDRSGASPSAGAGGRKAEGAGAGAGAVVVGVSKSSVKAPIAVPAALAHSTARLPVAGKSGSGGGIAALRAKGNDASGGAAIGAATGSVPTPAQVRQADGGQGCTLPVVRSVRPPSQIAARADRLRVENKRMVKWLEMLAEWDK